MAKNWPKNLESIANVALILCCVLVGAFLARNYLASRHRDTNSNTKHNIGSKPAVSSLVGKKLTIPDIVWSENQQTLLLILQKGCRFCDESAPFYKRLTKELSAYPGTHIVAVLPHGDDENKQYLKAKMLAITDVRQASPRLIGVPGTPALVLVDNTGTVLEQWLGKLPTAEEEAVLFRVKQ
jgi:thioredoxin-related protein